jgi:hypothetical protein
VSAYSMNIARREHRLGCHDCGVLVHSFGGRIHSRIGDTIPLQQSTGSVCNGHDRTLILTLSQTLTKRVCWLLLLIRFRSNSLWYVYLG